MHFFCREVSNFCRGEQILKRILLVPRKCSSKSLWQPMCHRKRILAPPCQGEAKKGSLWQATLNRVRSTPSSLPKWIGGSLHNILRAFREPAIHPEGNAIHGLVEGTISSEMERSVRGVCFAASDNETAFCKKYHRCTKHRKHLVDKYLMRHY